MRDWAEFFFSALIGALIAVIIIGFIVINGEGNERDFCQEMGEELNTIIRVMVAERIASGVCRFATDEGLIISYDGAFYFEGE